MGTVYRAVPEAGGQPVALKFLSDPLIADPDLRGRFAREVKVMRGLSHPGIVRVLADGHCDGMPWFAMELLVGQRPGARIKRGPLGAEEIATLFPPLLEALAHAHQANLVHRDLKPANVLLDTRGAPHLADFGIARPVGDAGLTRLTETSAVLGTLAYMAPEQRAGADVDARADLFSVGVMLYEAVTGRVPMGAFPPASKAARGFSRAFDRVITRLLAPDPDGRFASAEEARRALIAALRPPRRLIAERGRRRAGRQRLCDRGAGTAGEPKRAQGIDEYQQPERVRARRRGRRAARGARAAVAVAGLA